MTDPQTVLRRIAVQTAIRDALTAEIDEAKKTLGKTLGRGSMATFIDPADPTSVELGLLTQKKPSQPKPVITDEHSAMVWLLDEFDSDPALVEVRISEQGRKSILAAAESGKEVPGVTTPPPRPATVSFRQTPAARNLIMQQFGGAVLEAVEQVAAVKEIVQ